MLTWQTHKRFGGWTLSIGTSADVTLYAIHRSDHEPNNGRVYLNWGFASEAWVATCDQAIQAYAEGGMVAYIESGRDCDCVEYSGRVHVVPSTYNAYLELDDRIGEWADGPYHLEISRVSETQSVAYESRDLVIEAMENGHPHHIVSRFG